MKSLKYIKESVMTKQASVQITELHQAATGSPIILDDNKPFPPPVWAQRNPKPKANINGNHIERFLAGKEAIEAYGHGHIAIGFRWAFVDILRELLPPSDAVRMEHRHVDPITDMIDDYIEGVPRD